MKEDKGGYQKLHEVAIVSICCAHIRHHLLATKPEVARGSIRDKHIAGLEKEHRGLQRFIPEEIINLFQPKALRKLLLVELRKLEKMDALGCQLHYFQRITAASPLFGLPQLPAMTGIPPSAINITVDTVQVICCRAGSGDGGELVCLIEELSSVAMNLIDGRAVVHYMGKSGANKSLHLEFGESHEAESLCAMLEGYFRLQFPHRTLLVMRHNAVGEDQDTFVGVEGEARMTNQQQQQQQGGQQQQLQQPPQPQPPPQQKQQQPQQYGSTGTSSISRDQLKITATLGSGQFGTVFRGTLSQGGRTVSCAIKSISADSGMDRETFIGEAMLMKDLRHKYIVNLLGVVPGDSPLIVMELMPHGELRQYTPPPPPPREPLHISI